MVFSVVNFTGIWIWHSEDRVSWYILIIKPTRCTNFSNLYIWNRTLQVSDSFSVHHQKSSTVHTVKGVCHTGYADCLLARSGCSTLSRSQAVLDSWWRTEKLSETCRVIFQKHKFEKLVHLVGFIIRIRIHQHHNGWTEQFNLALRTDFLSFSLYSIFSKFSSVIISVIVIQQACFFIQWLSIAYIHPWDIYRVHKSPGVGPFRLNPRQIRSTLIKSKLRFVEYKI